MVAHYAYDADYDSSTRARYVMPADVAPAVPWDSTVSSAGQGVSGPHSASAWPLTFNVKCFRQPLQLTGHIVDFYIRRCQSPLRRWSLEHANCSSMPARSPDKASYSGINIPE
ncbi:hypothetical protein NDU88_006228 [Pleurodeles waltl]|uniref:Uncharacterized protein n=1 Tax=Pleurodeles waltl TaxID=8319 RepID=A0AAV7VLB1_PLEWA|nr:hypothetical protein NDU88_006228 [Pleurodeles waltl]